MGAMVEVDSDDLETLVYATGVVKAMELAIAAAKNDQQWLGVQPAIAAAVDRVAHAWRAAKKPLDRVPPSLAEQQMLIALEKKGATAEHGIPVDDPHIYRQMVARGLVKIGVHQHRMVWNSEPVPEFSQDAQQRLKLTDYAISVLPNPDDKPPRRSWLKGWMNGH